MRSRTKEYSDATKGKMKKGKILTNLIKEYLKIHQQGLSIYTLSEMCKVTTGAISGALKRLLEDDVIYIQEVEKSGRTLKLIFLKGKEKKENKVPGYFEIDKEHFGEVWKKQAIVYVISNNKIIITPMEKTKYKDFLKSSINIYDDGKKIKFALSDQLIDFYNLREHPVTVKPSQEEIVITVVSEEKDIQTKKSETKKIRVLLVEDEHDMTFKMLVTDLKNYFELDDVTNFDDALPMMRKKDYNFIVIDKIVFHKSIPLSVIKKMKQIRRNIHVILITRNAILKEEILRYVRNGVDLFLTKDVANLGEKIRTSIMELKQNVR